ncbi:YeeE/YedE family protein [Consotaella aegiceratis]|uniref:YeeE/YedE family protein n=1 Tax=Consotaella aegiceratis TaxID=3097961 RepID=UPI002F42A361
MRWLRLCCGFGGGLLFGVGLIVSGMADPAKVLNFLDLFGHWDPSLAFVMGGAVVVTFVGYRLVWRRRAPVLLEGFDLPAATRIDRRLVIGAALFGVGWGLGGFCPGPALTALSLAAPGTWAFVAAMLVGIWLGVKARQSSIGTPAG